MFSTNRLQKIDKIETNSRVPQRWTGAPRVKSAARLAWRSLCWGVKGAGRTRIGLCSALAEILSHGFHQEALVAR
jgi:hypothetical protein